MQPSLDAFTLQPALLAVPNRAGRPDLGGLRVWQSLETAHAFGIGSGPAAVAQMQRLSQTATARLGGRIDERAASQLSHTSNKKHDCSVFCAVIGI